MNFAIKCNSFLVKERVVDEPNGLGNNAFANLVWRDEMISIMSQQNDCGYSSHQQAAGYKTFQKKTQSQITEYAFLLFNVSIKF